MFKSSKDNSVYGPDMVSGDREATADEISAWKTSCAPTPLEQIRALEQKHEDDQRKLNRQAAIYTALTIACRSSAGMNMTREWVHEAYYNNNRGYRAMVDLEAQVAELRKLIV